MTEPTEQKGAQVESQPPVVHERKRRPPLTKAQKLVLQEKALELKLGGASYSRIASTLSDPKVVAALKLPVGFVVPKVVAWRLVDAAIRPTKEKVEDDAAKLRELQVRQREEVIRSLWPTRHQPRAADSIGRQLAGIARLKGLDAPVKVDAKVDAKVKKDGLPLEDLTDDELAEVERIAVAAAMRKTEEGSSEARDA